MSKRVLIAVGGTGGHLYPALSLARRLMESDAEIEVLFVGGKLSGNKYFQQESFPFKEIACSTLSLQKPWRICGNVAQILQGIYQSYDTISHFLPDIAVGFGSYHSLPVLLAAKYWGTPIVLHEGNRIAGKVNRLLSPYVALTGVQFPDTQWLKGNVREIPFPLRAGFHLNSLKKLEGYKYFGLFEERKTLLVFGGSQGAHALNRVISETISSLSDEIKKGIQVLHFTGGSEHVAAEIFRKYKDSGITAVVKTFEPHMERAWQIADLVISRAGAGTIAELLEFEVPAILIPYPHAMDNHQESNADFVVYVVKGALKYKEEGLSSLSMRATLETLFQKESSNLTHMQYALHSFKKNRQRKQELWSVLLEMLGYAELPLKTHYHFIGIGGIGMSGLARLMLKQGKTVSGSDLHSTPLIDQLRKEGASVFIGHSSENIPPHAISIYSSDIKADNIELIAAKKASNPLLHRSQLLAQVMQEHKSIAIAGTHGKTTTTALLTTVLRKAGQDPSYMVGGIMKATHTNAHKGSGTYFIVEADESDGTFLNYHPTGAIITNINLDHMVHFGTEEVLMNAFKQFAQQVSSQQLILWCAEDARLRSLGLKGMRYGFHSSCDVRISHWEQRGWRSVLDLHICGKDYCAIEAAMIGKHNALNVAAVFGMGILLGIDEEKLRQGLIAYEGVKRRCDRRGDAHGIIIIDDYAHHPVEIKTTLEGIRNAVGNQHLVAIFQPHRYTRTRDCLGLYGGIFDAADQLILTDIYASGESPIPEVSLMQIMAEINRASSLPCAYVPREELGKTLVSSLQRGALAVTLGAGDITRLYDEMQSIES
jgi:UDP-N-acetylmuramate--L-alanine ligase/undecaprenyldiphospho-muramoylpentapeptide beta-N-acetylglucosaminyltransferase